MLLETTHKTSWQELANSLAIGEIRFVEVGDLYGFLYKLEYNTIALEAIKAPCVQGGIVRVTTEVGLICDLNHAENLFYIEDPAKAAVETQAVAARCNCDLIKIMQVGCKCGVTTPYVGGLQYLGEVN